MPGLYDQVSAGTLPAFQKAVVARTLFTATARLRLLRSNKSIFRPWQGGTVHLVPYDIAPLPAGAYVPGVDVFTLEERQTFDLMTFGPRSYNAQVVINLAVTDLYNTKGPTQVVDILKEKYSNGSNSIDSQVAADLYIHGQPNSSTVASNRIKAINGDAEFLNDGFTPSWNGDVYTLVGGQTRNNSSNGTVLNSVPLWGGNLDGTAANISLQILNQGYNNCKQGKGEGKVIGGKPDLGVCSDFLWGRVGGLLLPMQKADIGVKEAKLGFEGIKFYGATIIADSYSPGTQNARYIQDASVLARITTAATITNPASTNTNVSLSNFPTTSQAATLVPGDIYTWIRGDSWRFSKPVSGAYSGKYSGMQTAIDGDMRADVLRLSMVNYCQVPSSNELMYGFAG
jgi:hypothetical protein